MVVELAAVAVQPELPAVQQPVVQQRQGRLGGDASLPAVEDHRFAGPALRQFTWWELLDVGASDGELALDDLPRLDTILSRHRPGDAAWLTGLRRNVDDGMITVCFTRTASPPGGAPRQTSSSSGSSDAGLVGFGAREPASFGTAARSWRATMSANRSAPAAPRCV